MKQSIEQRVLTNLDNALDNGYDMTNIPSDKVAEDVLMYADYDFEEEFDTMDEDVLLEQVRVAVEKWQNKRIK